MTTDQDSSTNLAAVRCRKCQNHIDVRTEDDVLDKFGDFFRLQCTTPECGHIDWYKGISLKPSSGPSPASQEPGEVWIHDVILGLSFKAESHPGHDIR